MQTTAHATFRQQVGRWIESQYIQNCIIGLIVFNALTLGMETSPTIQAHAGGVLVAVERAVLAVFVVEILIKLYAFDVRFFRNGWNTFDFVIVGIALLPAAGPFAILRALRILRILRLLTKIDRLRHIVESLLKAIPSIGWIALLLMMMFYIFAVIGTKLFAEAFPEHFGHLGLTMYSLFQIMTLESWSEAIARPVLDAYPWAWIYFVAFILISVFTVLNLFIGIIVTTMQEGHYQKEEAVRGEVEQRAHLERENMLQLLQRMDARIERLENALAGKPRKQRL